MTRSLVPREHGAYAQLGAPLVAALLAAHASVAALLLAAAAAVVFTAHEPLLVLLGRRGARARREDGRRARRRLVLAIVVAMFAALVALVLAPRARPWLMVPAVLAGLALLAILRGRERTLHGELVSAAALISTALPVAIAGDLPAHVALALCAVFGLASFLSTVEVRAIARRQANPIARAGAWGCAFAALVALHRAAPAFALSSLPVVGTVFVIAAIRPRPASLPRLGWALASASMMTTVAVVIAARA
jgi:hypothetical protein